MGALKAAFFKSFFVTFRDPGTHVRTVLPLQRELDSEGFRVSENQCVFDVFLRLENIGLPRGSFVIFHVLRGANGAHRVPKWLPVGFQKGQ